jgi:hypothetical protein
LKAAILCFLIFSSVAKAQEGDCTFKQPSVTIHFGAGPVRDLNTEPPPGYRRISNPCPKDGQYVYTPFTSDCFGGDWLTLPEDHTTADAAGNMLLVNASWSGGPFLKTTLNGLKSNTIYELGLWLMNVCKPSDKCPFPLLPVITIRLQTPEGKTVAQFSTGELVRRYEPLWTQYRAVFTMPAASPLTLTMIDNSPGGCGNDFALDDITFRECIKPPPAVVIKSPEKITVRRPPAITNRIAKKELPAPARKTTKITSLSAPQPTSPSPAAPVIQPRLMSMPEPPPVLKDRENQLQKSIQTEAGDIRLDLYDNGEIDGDTVTIYHNNRLMVSRAGLSQKPISFRLVIDAAHPHHELVMVANNLGSIPPNTSLMIVTTPTQRYEVFISSNEQKNAKLIFDLKK